jgi:hypothetical protein
MDLPIKRTSFFRRKLRLKYFAIFSDRSMISSFYFPYSSSSFFVRFPPLSLRCCVMYIRFFLGVYLAEREPYWRRQFFSQCRLFLFVSSSSSSSCVFVFAYRQRGESCVCVFPPPFFFFVLLRVVRLFSLNRCAVAIDSYSSPLPPTNTTRAQTHTHTHTLHPWTGDRRA